MYGGRLTRDFGDSAPDAWASTIRSLTDYQIQRGLKRLADSGSGSTPTLPQFTKACKQIGGDDGPLAPVNNALPAPQIHYMTAFANRALINFLQRAEGTTSEKALKKMLTEKKRICDLHIATGFDEAEDGAKILREQLFAAFEKCLEPMPEFEMNRHSRSFKNSGFAADWL
jgi:hypothetical protein